MLKVLYLHLHSSGFASPNIIHFLTKILGNEIDPELKKEIQLPLSDLYKFIMNSSQFMDILEGERDKSTQQSFIQYYQNKI